MLDCPILDRRGHCLSFTDYILSALILTGMTDTTDMEAALNYTAEKMLMGRSLESGKPRATVFDDFDETRPFGPDDNPLQAGFLSYLRWSINNIRRGRIRRLSNVERRPKGTVSITPGRQRRGDPHHGVSADVLADRPSGESDFKELIDDIAGLLAHKEAATRLPLGDLFRAMMAGARSHEQRKLYGDDKARHARQIIVQTVGEYARSTGNRQLQRLLARLRGEVEEEPRKTLTKVAPAPVLPEKERDYASILSVLDRLNRPVGSADLGKYRR
jgi:hypothetical protein